VVDEHEIVAAAVHLVEGDAVLSQFIILYPPAFSLPDSFITQKRRVKFRYPDIKRLSSIYLSPAPWSVEIVSGSGPW
jgi:hypothetical protein